MKISKKVVRMGIDSGKNTFHLVVLISGQYTYFALAEVGLLLGFLGFATRPVSDLDKR